LLQLFTPSRNNMHNVVIWLAVVSFAAAYGLSNLKELYILQAIPWLIILSLPFVPRKSHRFVWVAVYVCMAAAFFLYRVYIWQDLGVRPIH
jgi:hypothetical protein